MANSRAWNLRERFEQLVLKCLRTWGSGSAPAHRPWHSIRPAAFDLHEPSRAFMPGQSYWQAGEMVNPLLRWIKHQIPLGGGKSLQEDLFCPEKMEMAKTETREMKSFGWGSSAGSLAPEVLIKGSIFCIHRRLMNVTTSLSDCSQPLPPPPSFLCHNVTMCFSRLKRPHEN